MYVGLVEPLNFHFTHVPFLFILLQKKVEVNPLILLIRFLDIFGISSRFRELIHHIKLLVSKYQMCQISTSYSLPKDVSDSLHPRKFPQHQTISPSPRTATATVPPLQPSLIGKNMNDSRHDNSPQSLQL